MTKTLSLYNTFTKETAPLAPLKPGHIGLYVCGITAYDLCHLGHARVFVFFDVFCAYLKHCGYEVNYVRNVTDIDDKILARARERNIPPLVLSEQYTQEMQADLTALGVAEPNVEPRVSTHMPEIIAFIERLLKQGYAYKIPSGDVYFSVREYPDYGQLSGQQIDALLSSTHEEDFIKAEKGEKQDPLDFALWKATKPDEGFSFESPFGAGRPGWHIECSAMSLKHLGAQFDIHGGGPDLLFPHHENERAQSICAHGHFADHWMHVGALQVEGKKMSKSLNNFLTIKDALAHYHPEVVRLFLIKTHYRQAINYTAIVLEEAKHMLDKFYQALLAVSVLEVPLALSREVSVPLEDAFYDALKSDMNTALALTHLNALSKQIFKELKQEDFASAQHNALALVRCAHILGFLKCTPHDYFQSLPVVCVEKIEAQIQARQNARLQKNWAEADAIRDALLKDGIVLEDKGKESIWRTACIVDKSAGK